MFLLALLDREAPPPRVTAVLAKEADAGGLPLSLPPDAAMTLLRQPTAEYPLKDGQISPSYLPGSQLSARHQRSRRYILEFGAGETASEVIIMDKRDLTYPNRRVQPEKEWRVIPKVSGQRKAGVVDVHSAHRAAHDPDRYISRAERLASRACSLGDNDLARDNLANDLPNADLQDL